MKLLIYTKGLNKELVNPKAILDLSQRMIILETFQKGISNLSICRLNQ